MLDFPASNVWLAEGKLKILSNTLQPTCTSLLAFHQIFRYFFGNSWSKMIHQPHQGWFSIPMGTMGIQPTESPSWDEHRKDFSQGKRGKAQIAMNSSGKKDVFDHEIHGSLFSQIHHVLPYAQIGPAFLVWRADAFGTISSARDRSLKSKGCPGSRGQWPNIEGLEWAQIDGTYGKIMNMYFWTKYLGIYSESPRGRIWNPTYGRFHRRARWTTRRPGGFSPWFICWVFHFPSWASQGFIMIHQVLEEPFGLDPGSQWLDPGVVISGRISRIQVLQTFQER